MFLALHNSRLTSERTASPVWILGMIIIIVVNNNSDKTHEHRKPVAVVQSLLKEGGAQMGPVVRAAAWEFK